MPDHGLSPSDAYQQVRVQASDPMDPALNLAQHHTAWMEPQADQLIAENLHRSSSAEAQAAGLFAVQQHVTNLFAELFNAPAEEHATGVATAGSVEGFMLAGLAHSRRWRARRSATGQPSDRPNIVISADQPLPWLRFASYFDVEPRIAPVGPARYTLAPEAVGGLLDERTIALTTTLSSAVTGEPDPVAELSTLLDELEARHGWDIPLHVDAAGGAFILPFTEPELVWDFRLPRVKTISVSSHQHGGVYPGLGWLVFRQPQDLPRELLLDTPVNGRREPTLTLSASHGGALALAQFYNLLRHGRAGYGELAVRVVGSATYLADRLSAIEHFELIGRGRRLPVVAVCTPADRPAVSLVQLGAQLGQRGWAVEAGPLPGTTDQAELMRFIVSEHFSRDMADLLARDILDDIEAQRA